MSKNHEINKFIVQAVILVRENGEITGELTSDPATVYGTKSLRDWVDGFEAEVKRMDLPEASAGAETAL